MGCKDAHVVGFSTGWVLERYSYMLSEKSSLVFTVMLPRSKACLG